MDMYAVGGLGNVIGMPGRPSVGGCEGVIALSTASFDDATELALVTCLEASRSDRRIFTATPPDGGSALLLEPLKSAFITNFEREENRGWS